MQESNYDTSTLSDADLAAKAQEELNMEGEMNEVRLKGRWELIHRNLLKNESSCISFSQLFH